MTVKSILNKPKSILNKKAKSKVTTAANNDKSAPIKIKTIAKTHTTGAPKADHNAPIATQNDVILPKSHYDRPENILRVTSVNVNGLRAAEKKGFLLWLQNSEVDVVCIQESRITHEQWTDKFKPEGWHTHLFPAERAGYAGTAIYSRIPFTPHEGLGFELADSQGRFIAGEFDFSAFGVDTPVYIASLYLPSGSSGEEAQARKDSFLADYKEILKRWRAENRSIIVCGDYNIVHKRIDIKNWSGNQKSSGCLPHERAWLDYIYDELGYVDTFREVRKESEVYSWWSNRGQARAKNVGWRIDYHACSADWKARTVNAWVYKDEWFSDHAPVVIDYDLSV